MHKKLTGLFCFCICWPIMKLMNYAQDSCKFSCDSIIHEHIKSGELRHAIAFYQKMMKQESYKQPTPRTFVALLNACAKLKDIETGHDIHLQVSELRLLEIDMFVCSSVVNMYAKCGSVEKAHEVFKQLPVRNVVIWNALITGYAQNECCKNVIDCYKQMRLEGISPDAVTFTCVLKACAQTRSLEKGIEVHNEVAKNGLLKTNVFVGNMLLDMYGKLGMLDRSQEIFDMLPLRNVVTWTSLISAYTQHKRDNEALLCFEKMQLEGVSPNVATYSCVLKACGNIELLEKGNEIYTEVSQKGLFETDIIIGSSLLDMYAKCGMLMEAKAVFDKLPVRNVITWTALITGYVQHEYCEEALNCYKKMQFDGVSANTVTFASILRACGSLGDIRKGIALHAEFSRSPFSQDDLFVSSALVDMYAKLCLHTKAQETFDSLLFRDLVTWNALIAGYAQNDHGEAALGYFEQMQVEGVIPDSVMYACSLKACSSIDAKIKGMELHARIVMIGGFDLDLSVGTALVDMYAKCGGFLQAQTVFAMMPVKNTIAWNALIAGYVRHECDIDVLNCLSQMQKVGTFPDLLTYVFSLKACGNIGAVEKGSEIHSEVSRKQMLGLDPCLGSALVEMYAKCDCLRKAKEVFDVLLERDVYTWNGLIGGCVQYEHNEEALAFFEKMEDDHIHPNAATYTCIIKACENLGTSEKGSVIHADVARLELPNCDLFIGSALVDMYAKCGLADKAKEVFDTLTIKNLVTWNALITGYSQLGEIDSVFRILERMIGDGNEPDSVTFLAILSACNHAGLVDKGCRLFRVMAENNSIIPTVAHHSCIIDLLGRAGQLDRSLIVMKETPFHPNNIMWLAVLAACRKWGNMELAVWAFHKVKVLSENHVSAYVCMFNMYADAEIMEMFVE